MIELPTRFFFERDLRERFLEAGLWRTWADSYPQLFDEDDRRIAETQATPRVRAHFFEWLGAILIYHTTGCYSLIEQYQFKKHGTKREKLLRIVTEPSVLEYIQSIPTGKTQCPDLLVYDPVTLDWRFCEVKGPYDSVSPKERERFDDLERLIGNSIHELRFHPISGRRQIG